MIFTFFRIWTFPALVCVLLGGCASRQVATLPQVNASSRYSENYYSGTANLWAVSLEEVHKSGKPQTLLLDHGEDALILRVNLIRSAQESVLGASSWPNPIF